MPPKKAKMSPKSQEANTKSSEGGKKKKVASNDDSNDEGGPAFPEKTKIINGDKLETAFKELKPEERKRIVSTLTRHIIFSGSKRITKKGMQEILTKERQKYFNIALAESQKELRSVFGMELVQLCKEDKGDRATNLRTEIESMSDNWALMSTLKPTHTAAIAEAAKLSSDRLPKRGFLMVVLGIVACKDNDCTEDELKRALNVIGVDLDSKESVHDRLGTPATVLSELRTESYLLLIKADTDAARPSSYRWGPRARAEFSFPDLVHFICEIMDLDATNELARLKKSNDSDSDDM